MTLFLSRLTLRSDPDAAALRHLIDPVDQNRAMDAHHRLIWTLFADGRDRTRDFLWRSENRGRFYTLSSRPPVLQTGLFEPPEVKLFEPNLKSNDRLRFTLRVNATRSRTRAHQPVGDGRRRRGQRVDIVMDALHAIPGRARLPGTSVSARAAVRHDVAGKVAAEWMEAQGTQHGFLVEEIQVTNYRVVALPPYRGPRRGQPQFGMLDINGTLSVTNPEDFLAKLAMGFGRAKTFGGGLMMLRRA